MALEPVVVATAIEGSGDDTEMILAEPQDGEVAAKATVGRQERGVDRAANGHVDTVDGHALQVCHGAGAGNVELAERREIDHADVLAHRHVFGVDDRRPPAGIPFVRAILAHRGVLLDQGCVRGVPLRAFPATSVEERGAKGLFTWEEWAAAHVALSRPLLAGMHDAIGLVEVLAATSIDMVLGLFVGVEAADVGRMRLTDVRVAVGHPLGNELGDAGALLDPDGSGRPEILHFNGLAKHRHRVGCERQETVDCVADFGGLKDLGHQFERLFHLRIEILIGEGKFGRRQGRCLV